MPDVYVFFGDCRLQQDTEPLHGFVIVPKLLIKVGSKLLTHGASHPTFQIEILPLRKAALVPAVTVVGIVLAFMAMAIQQAYKSELRTASMARSFMCLTAELKNDSGAAY